MATALAVVGTVVSFVGSMASANAAQEEADQRAALMEAEGERARIKGEQENARAQIEAQRKSKKARLAIESARAAAAKGSGSVSGDAITQIANLASYGKYQERMQLAMGEEMEQQGGDTENMKRAAAANERAAGANKRSAMMLGAFGNLAGGLSSTARRSGYA